MIRLMCPCGGQIDIEVTEDTYGKAIVAQAIRAFLEAHADCTSGCHCDMDDSEPNVACPQCKHWDGKNCKLAGIVDCTGGNRFEKR